MTKHTFFFIILFTTTVYAQISSYTIFPKQKSDNTIGIEILDVKELHFDGVHELSALVYDNGRLYALSDSGILYLFRISFQQDHIDKLTLQADYILTNKKSEPFTKKKHDSEGMAAYKDGLLISFERKNRILYCSRKGKKIKKMKLNIALENNKNFQSPNKGLESVAYSTKYGLLTIPELPLKKSDYAYHTLYAADKTWKFTAEGAVTDMTFMNSNTLLVLLREFSYLTQRRVSSLVTVDLSQCNKKDICKSKVLAKMDSNDGWNIDNFEGLTKVGAKRFLMISDDNDSMFQKTLLVLFEIKN